MIPDGILGCFDLILFIFYNKFRMLNSWMIHTLRFKVQHKHHYIPAFLDFFWSLYYYRLVIWLTVWWPCKWKWHCWSWKYLLGFRLHWELLDPRRSIFSGYCYGILSFSVLEISYFSSGDFFSFFFFLLHLTWNISLVCSIFSENFSSLKPGKYLLLLLFVL